MQPQQKQYSVLDKTHCDLCMHVNVCKFKEEGNKPEVETRTINVFNTVVRVQECVHFRETIR